MGNHRQRRVGDRANLTKSPVFGNARRHKAWFKTDTQAGKPSVCATPYG